MSKEGNSAIPRRVVLCIDAIKRIGLCECIDFRETVRVDEPRSRCH